MPDAQRIDPVLVEKVAKRLYEGNHGPEDGVSWEEARGIRRRLWREDAEAVIRVVFDELRLKEECREPLAGTSTRVHGQLRCISDWISVDKAGHPIGRGDDGQ